MSTYFVVFSYDLAQVSTIAKCVSLMWARSLCPRSRSQLPLHHLVGFSNNSSSILPVNVRHEMCLVIRKPVFGGLRTTKAQTSLHIRAVWSAPLLFAFLKARYKQKFNFLASLWSRGDWFEFPKTGFLTMRPK